MITKTYTMEEETVEMLKTLREQKGISASWLVNTAVQQYIEKEKLLER